MPEEGLAILVDPSVLGICQDERFGTILLLLLEINELLEVLVVDLVLKLPVVVEQEEEREGVVVGTGFQGSSRAADLTLLVLVPEGGFGLGIAEIHC